MLYQEVHTIAYYYGWAEENILRLSSRKRETYVKLIREQVKRENEAHSEEASIEDLY